MPHDISLIAILAIGFACALIFGYIAHYFKMSPLVGYLFAGILIGPATPGYQADIGLAKQLAEIGVMLLMFGVGLHFSIRDLLSVKKIAIPGAIFQIITAVILGTFTATMWGWSLAGGIVFGLCLSVASTVVLLTALEKRNLLNTVNGKIAVGWLVVEDLVMVLVLVLLPVINELFIASKDASQAQGVAQIIGPLLITLLKIAGFIIFMLVIGKRVLPKILWLVAKTGSRELFTLAVIACAIGTAFGAAKLFDVSFALGAFFAGMMLRESEFSHRAAEESLPFQDAFSVLFFLSVGMLFEPAILIDAPLKLLIVVAIIMVGKTLAAIGLVLLFKYPLKTAITVGASLAQIGEFSFILAGMGLSMNFIPQEGYSLILAGALISIACNAFIFKLIGPFIQLAIAKSSYAKRLDLREDPLAQLPLSVDPDLLSGQVVIVGYGRVGRKIVESLHQKNISYVITDVNREIVKALRQKNMPAVRGDASHPNVLIQAHIARASFLIIATTNPLDIYGMIAVAKQLNPTIQVLIRAKNSEEASLYQKADLGETFIPEDVLADKLAELVILRKGASG